MAVPLVAAMAAPTAAATVESSGVAWAAPWETVMAVLSGVAWAVPSEEAWEAPSAQAWVLDPGLGRALAPPWALRKVLE